MALTKVNNRMIDGATFNVKDYGAVGDGVTDDRAAINAAFNDCYEQGSGTVYFPFGTYSISEYIGGTTKPSTLVSIAVDADPDTLVVCNPSNAMNYALDLRFTTLGYGIVKNLEVNCNDKCSVAIRVSGQNSANAVIIENCNVFNCFRVDTPLVTTSAAGITSNSDLGGFCSIRNCEVSNVSREVVSFSQGIAITGWLNTEIDSNIVFNVSHGGVSPLQDADGIAVFSYNDGTGNYYRECTASIRNNRIFDCEGRHIKTQSNGSCLIEGNMLAIDTDIELIQNYRAIDSQVAQATVVNNKIYIGDAWTGGASGTIFSIQNPGAGTINEPFEGFVQKFNDNEVYLKKQFTYGVLPADFDANTEVQCHMQVCRNTFMRDAVLTSTSDYAIGRFIYVGSFIDVADADGNLIWEVCDNKVSAGLFIGYGDTNVKDFSDKWWMYISGNKMYGAFDFLVRNFGANPYDCPYTSNVMISNNQMGTAPGSTASLFNLYAMPLDSTKLIEGSDFSTGDGAAGTISPAPANWRNGHFGRKGGVLFAETVASATAYRYISRDNGSNWYQV